MHHFPKGAIMIVNHTIDEITKLFNKPTLKEQEFHGLP